MTYFITRYTHTANRSASETVLISVLESLSSRNYTSTTVYLQGPFFVLTIVPISLTIAHSICYCYTGLAHLYPRLSEDDIGVGYCSCYSSTDEKACQDSAVGLGTGWINTSRSVGSPGASRPLPPFSQVRSVRSGYTTTRQPITCFTVREELMSCFLFSDGKCSE
jgi:hypothetical protein